MRVALYARVSTEEQVKHGISIDAQVAALHKWAEDNDHEIIGEYIDNGVSARKSPSKRPELQRLLLDFPAKRTELVAFVRLDRWTRNVKGYYQVQDVLDKYKVSWVAIQEDYETVTASGRMKVNIMLSVAENEADRTSERIKTALAYKVDKGEYIGGAFPYGYIPDGKSLVPDPEKADTIRELFQRYLAGESYYQLAAYMDGITGKRWQFRYIRRILCNRIYIGEFHDNLTFCEPIIDKSTFDAVQARIGARAVRHNPTGRVYIFSGLLRCECCNTMLSGWTRRDIVYYRCGEALQYRRCEHTRSIREDVLELWLLEHIADEIDAYTAKYTVKAKNKQPRDDAAVKRKLDRLKDLYLDELITKEQYKADREKLLAQLDAQKPTQTMYDDIKKQFSGDFRSVYSSLSRQQKAAFWKGTIDTIFLDAENKPRIIFR